MHQLKNPILWLRLALGWLFFYAGITKVVDSSWSAEGFLNGAKTFSSFYAWFALPSNIGWVNLLNEWGLTLIGIALILGIATRLASYAGIMLMALYYIPGLSFPYVNNGLLVDQHIIYILVLCLIIKNKEHYYWGLQKLIPWKKK